MNEASGPLDRARRTNLSRSRPEGDGETHPFLSPDDQFADYETWHAVLVPRPPRGRRAILNTVLE